MIELCKKCSGTGQIVIRDYDGDDYKKCQVCFGTGRLEIYHYQIEVPIGLEKTEFYKVDSEIREMIRNFIKKQNEKFIPEV